MAHVYHLTVSVGQALSTGWLTFQVTPRCNPGVGPGCGLSRGSTEGRCASLGWLQDPFPCSCWMETFSFSLRAALSVQGLPTVPDHWASPTRPLTLWCLCLQSQQWGAERGVLEHVSWLEACHGSHPHSRGRCPTRTPAPGMRGSWGHLKV